MLLGFRSLPIAKRGEVTNQCGVDRQFVVPANSFEQVSRFN